MLTIFNSLTRKKEIFKTINPGQIRLYVCGNTVYDYCHIGHGRVMIMFDVLVRYLRARGYEVIYVRNITDIDDKIINRAKEKKIAIEELTTFFINAMHEDELALGNILPNQEPKATEFIPQMIGMIETLITKGYAYVADNGDVYYEVNKFSKYGCLSHKSIEGLRAGARVEINESKRDPLDFALWKLAKPGEPAWDSPWGKGRPGWHIECSAMSTFCLGNHFDLHGGGYDLQFPHHENEIAQAEAATNEHFVNTWMHVGYVQINKEKMSKSLGNFTTLREVLVDYQPEVLRYFMISSHYRSPINYSEENLQYSKAALERLYTSLRGIEFEDEIVPEENLYVLKFYEAMSDDFNTPEALTVLFELSHEINRLREFSLKPAAELAKILHHLANTLGLLKQNPEEFLQSGLTQTDVAKVENLISERNKARAEKNWSKADELRDELTSMGIILEDSAKDTTWRRG